MAVRIRLAAPSIQDISMFFHISNKTHIDNSYLSQKSTINDFIVQTDLGWNRYENTIYKGYCLGKNLHDKVAKKDYAKETGNYIIIDLDNPAVYYDDCRSFPLFLNQNTLTNIEIESVDQIWLDSDVFFNNGWNSVYNHENDIKFDSTKPYYNFQSIVDYVCDYMVKSVQDLQIDLPIYVADSNGVDSNVVRSAFDYVGKSYELVQSTDDKEELWGYKQLHYSQTPHLQVTGFCGDEIMLRNPQYVQWLLKPFGIDITDEYDKYNHTYMLGFFNTKYRKKIKDIPYDLSTKEKSFNHVKSWVSNDYQMWHIDNIITFTPFRNSKLIELQLYAEPDALIRQCVHADISFEVIKRLNPNNLSKITKNKNNYSVDGTKINEQL